MSFLASEAKRRGLKFGLWFEPEMANTRSELLRDHPDWCLQAAGRPLRCGRGGTQVVLDMANPALRDAVCEDGIPVLGYTAWGCIDLVSASSGEMKKRYGFIYVDKNNEGTGTLARSREDSFWWYKKVIASNGRDLD